MSGRRTREERIREREELPSDAFPMLDHLVDFPAVEQTESPALVRRLGRIAGVAFGVYILLRPQQLEAPLSGRLIESRVVEGQAVQSGDVLFVMGANDPQLRENLELQREAAQDKLEAADEKLEGYRRQLAAAEAALPETIAAAQLELDAARVAAARRLRSPRPRRLAVASRWRARARWPRSAPAWRPPDPTPPRPHSRSRRSAARPTPTVGSWSRHRRTVWSSV